MALGKAGVPVGCPVVPVLPLLEKSSEKDAPGEKDARRRLESGRGGVAGGLFEF